MGCGRDGTEGAMGEADTKEPSNNNLGFLLVFFADAIVGKSH